MFRVSGVDGDAIDQLAERLRSDPVVIDVAMGSGRAREYDDRLSALVRDLPFEAYVALVEHPDGLSDDRSRDLPGLLHRRLDEPGLYVVQTTEGPWHIQTFGVDQPGLSDDVREALDEVDRRVSAAHDVNSAVLDGVIASEVALRTALAAAADPGRTTSPHVLPEGDLADLTQRADELYRAQHWRRTFEPDHELHEAQLRRDRTWLVGTVTAGAVFGLVLLLLRNLTPRRGRMRVDLSRLRAHARSRLEALATALSETEWEALADRDAADRAGLARAAAEPLLDSDALVDLVGAQLLAESGLRDLEIARTGVGESFRPCFLDPRHGEATDVMRWRLGQGSTQVPVCDRCRSADRAGTPRKPMSRELHGDYRRLDPDPWFEVDDVWTRTGFGGLTDEFAADVLSDRSRSSR